MPYTNLNHGFSPEKRAQMTECFEKIMDMMSFGVSLTPEERMEMRPRSSSRTEFMDKVFSHYAQEHPQYRPGFGNFDESQKDYELFNDMMAMETLCMRVLEAISDTRMVASQEAHTYARTYFDMCERASKNGDHAAQQIHEDLRPYLQMNGNSSHRGPGPDGVERAA